VTTLVQPETTCCFLIQVFLEKKVTILVSWYNNKEDVTKHSLSVTGYNAMAPS